MNKYIAILLAALLTTSGKSSAAEEWHCWKYSYDHSGTPLVKLRQSDDRLSGSVEVFGETHLAQVDISGLNKRWAFGEDYSYALVIRPDGFAAYYDFSFEDRVKPSMSFHCSLTKPSAKQRQRLHTGEKLPAEEYLSRHNSLREAYRLAIKQKIERNWRQPQESGRIPDCEVRIIQGPGGIILDVSFGACQGGTTAYRMSIENAVYKSEPLPKPADPSLFERELIILFNPG